MSTAQRVQFGLYVGGLKYQIEYHLFPKVFSVHFPAVILEVRQAAAAHGVPYHEQPTLLRAIRSHYRMLKHFGREAGSDASDKQGGMPTVNCLPSPGHFCCHIRSGQWARFSWARAVAAKGIGLISPTGSDDWYGGRLLRDGVSQGAARSSLAVGDYLSHLKRFGAHISQLSGAGLPYGGR